MSDAPGDPPREYDLYFLLPDAAGTRLLIADADAGPALLHTTGATVDAWEPAELAAWLHTTLGVRANVLRMAYRHEEQAGTPRAGLVYALENRDPAWAPPLGWRWVGPAALAAVALTPAAIQPAVAAWAAEDAIGAIPPLRAPWARPGWRARADTWITARLAALGHPVSGPITPVKSWGISCVLRADTAAGAYYFKATPAMPLFTVEPTVTAALAALFPGQVPRPVAVEPADRWLLLADFGGEPLRRAPLLAWEAAAAAFGALQRLAIPHVPALLAAGCLDRRLATLPAALDSLVAATATQPGFAADEPAALAASVPRLRALCAELAACGIPETLLHGDLHGANMALCPAGPLFFDWTDAAIAHPFLDLATLLDVAWLGAIGPHAGALRARYLAAWAGIAPPDRLARAADLGMILGCLHQAISYQHLTLSLEPAVQWEMRGGWVSWLRRLIAALRAASSQF